MLRITCLVLLSIFFIVAIIFIALLIIYPSSSGCKPTITTASGFAVPGEICAGNLIFEENFERLDKHKWKPEVTFWGGGNGEFQWYTADDVNSFVKNKKLYIKPTLTANKIGYDAVEHGYVRLDDCTDSDKTQCERQAGGNIIINPVQSARLTTEKSFSFKYGRVEVISKLPTADYLWPAVWLMPRVSKYGLWPRSGEIDLMESRGNNNYTDLNGIQFGAKRTTSTLHFGPSSQLDKWQTSTYAKINETGFNNGFHIYEFIWNEKGFIFYVDRAEIGSVPVGDGFWKRGDFQGNDIWASGTKMAPFDQEFHFIINLEDGKLHIKPTLTANKIGYDAVENGHIRLDDCTDQDKSHCECQAGGDKIINPVRSARLRTHKSFSFKYGRAEVVAKTPSGDWLWPAVWLLPTQWKYGGWPRSGEIDLLESRGNEKYGNEQQIGAEEVFSTLHFGPRWDMDAYQTASYSRNNASGFDKDFHKYEMVWNENGIKFFVDGIELGFAELGDGFWKRGGFSGDNIWAQAEKMAPFDQEFHFIINLAIGGTNGYFPDNVNNKDGPKPWRNQSPTGMKDFWTGRSQWLQTWRSREKSSLIVDSVKVWAI